MTTRSWRVFVRVSFCLFIDDGVPGSGEPSGLSEDAGLNPLLLGFGELIGCMVPRTLLS